MGLDTSRREQPHYCPLPSLAYRWKYPDKSGMDPDNQLLADVYPGDRFICEVCSQGYVCVRVPDQVGPRAVICAHNEWRPETWWQRRRRRRRETREGRCQVGLQ